MTPITEAMPMFSTAGVSESRIGEFTGHLSVFEEMDRISQLRHQVTCTECWTKRHTDLYSNFMLKITVDDINDNRWFSPVNNSIVKVCKDIPVGTMITIITVIDPNVGQKSQLY